MEFSEYQKRARETAIYPDVGENFIYPALGLAGETGEVIEHVKKLMRDAAVSKASDIPEDRRDNLEKEMGDVVWYLAQLASELGLELETIASRNIEKLQSRKDRGVLHGDGDNR
ncbi:nucleoside triphosphate pyrophosphohydrolase family protein [Candidatus Kaiserbacteria bacterium]|nr:nucleoside triphosphate pyrophosphohydrolase family protein [Candidatus Kaiserbacteria bacterium]